MAGRLVWWPDGQEPLRVVAAWQDADGPYELAWGDGDVTVNAVPGRSYVHTYAQAGAYMLTAHPGGRVGGRVAGQVMVRQVLVPGLTLAATRDNPNVWELTFAERERGLISWYRVDWGDSSTPQEVPGPAGSAVQHGYRDGTYTVAVQDTSTRRWWRRTITVRTPQQDPVLTFSFPDPAGAPRRVRAELTAAAQAGKTVAVDWGVDASRPELTAVGQTAEHTYAQAGAYIVQAYYTDGSGDGAAWVVEVPGPGQRVTKPASMLLVQPDPLDPLAVWVTWMGAGADYTLHWGDGETTRRLWWQPPVKHRYPGVGRYLVRGVNDLGSEVQQWLELKEPDPPPQQPEPVFAVLKKDSGLRVRVRLLFRPPTPDDPYDHRAVEHDIDWGDGHTQHVPAGTAYVDRDYLPGKWAWPADRPLPTVTVTATATGKQARQVVQAVRPTRMWVAWDASGVTGPALEAMVGQLPTRGPGTAYQVWSGGQLVHTQAPGDNSSYFQFTREWPLSGWASASVVAPGGQELHALPLWHRREQGVCAYDWDWRGDPRLIICTPWLFGTARGPYVGAFDVDWGDATSGEQVVLPPEGEQQRAVRDALDNPGQNPELPHWYAAYGTYTLTITPDRASGPTQRLIGPCEISGPVEVAGQPGTVRLDVVTQDAWHPVRIDWGDGTPITRQHPAAGSADGRSGSLTHRYARAGQYTVTVYAPMQPVQEFSVEITQVKGLTNMTTFSATYTPASQWWGGYSATYRVTNHGTAAAPWELVFSLAEPSKVVDVWGGGMSPKPGERQHQPTRPNAPTAPGVALYRTPEPAGGGAATPDGATLREYKVVSTQPLAAGASVDFGFRVEAHQEQVSEPQSCSINGGPCAGPRPPIHDDTKPPTPPTSVKVTAAGPKTLTLGWTESTDDTGVRKYVIAVDGDVAQEVPAPAAGGTVTGLEPQTEYELKVQAVDLAGNRSLWSQPVRGRTSEPVKDDGKLWQAKVAPFVDMGLYPTPQLATFSQESTLRAFNLGFITAPGGGQACQAVWAGQPTYAVKDGWQKDNIRNFNAQAGHTAVISFGGEAGHELAQVAKNADEVYAQYKLVIDTYGVTHVDFDIEGAAQRDQPANERRAAAVARLQKEYPELRVSWTLPVLPEGLVADGLNVLRTAHNHGVRIDLVNIMAMVFNRQGDMGELVQRSMEATHEQLAEFFPGVSPKQRWSKLSVCPMIGQNNDNTIYSLDHAAKTAAFAAAKGLGQLTYWEAGRDRNACMSPALYQCTNVPQEPWDYARRFAAYQDPAPAPSPAKKATGPRKGKGA